MREASENTKCLVKSQIKIGTPSKEPGAGGWYPKGKRRHPCGPEQGMGIREEGGGPRGPMQKGVSGRKEEDPGRRAGAGWESGGKGKPPRKKKRILKGEVKNLGNLPIK